MRRAAYACLLLVLVACEVRGGSTGSATPSSSGPVTLSAADRAEVVELEKKPLTIPAPAADGQCHQGPFTPHIAPWPNGAEELEVYGSGPVYAEGGPSQSAGPYIYFSVMYFTDPTVDGVVLVRINDLGRKYVGRFFGAYAVGQSLGVDTVAGRQVPVFSELALPAESRPHNGPSGTQGWGIWQLSQGIDQQYTCAAIQIDTATTTEVILAH